LPRPIITSKENPQVKALLRLRKQRERRAVGRVVVEGVRDIGRAVGAGLSLITLGRWDEDGFVELRQVVGSRLPDNLAAWCESARRIVVMTRQDDLLLRHALVVGGHVEAVMAAEGTVVSLARSAGHARHLEESLLSLVRDDDGDDRACELLLREALDDRNPESWRRLLARGTTDLTLVVGVWLSLED